MSKVQVFGTKTAFFVLQGGGVKFINKTESQNNNICDQNIVVFRQGAGLSQNQLAVQRQLHWRDEDNNDIQRIEAGK